MEALTTELHSGEITEQRMRFFIGHLDCHLSRRLLHIELFAPGRPIECLVKGIHPAASRGAIEVRTLHLHRTHHGLDRSRNDGPSRQAPMTLGATGNPSSQLTTMSLMNNRLAQATGELLTQRPHRLSHLS